MKKDYKSGDNIICIQDSVDGNKLQLTKGKIYVAKSFGITKNVSTRLMYQHVSVINDLGKSHGYKISFFESLEKHRKEVIDDILM